MPKLEELGKVTEADVLVIGGGFAGAWAAIRARQFVGNVVLVDKAKIAKSGCSTFAAGVQLCPTREDDLDAWKKEIVQASEYFADQDWIDVFLKNQIERIEDYERWGVPLERDSKGKTARIAARGHINTRVFQFHGPRLMAELRQQALAKGIRLMERIMIVDLLTSDGIHPTKGSVVGAIGFHTRSGQFHIFRAKATVMAAGSLGSKKSRDVDNCTGDGVAGAFRAGAELTNMEFCTNGNISVWERKGMTEGTNMMQGHGAYYVNAKGERFMLKYDPVLKERALLFKVCAGFCKETMEGRGPIYVDMRHFPPETFDKFRRVIPKTMKFWAELGVDVSKQKIECTPNWGVRSYAGQGGIKVDSSCRTSIPGLYAAGAVTRIPVQGIYAVGGVATASSSVMGYVAGEDAALLASKAKFTEVEPKQVVKLKEYALSPLHQKDGITPSEFFIKVDKAIVPAAVSMFKCQRRILKALADIEKNKQDLVNLSASDYHELVKANEFRNYLLSAELVYRAALERQESRQYHYREDYPYCDNANWLKLIVLKKEGEALTIRHEPIPIDRWPVKPEKRVKTSHPVQMFLGE